MAEIELCPPGFILACYRFTLTAVEPLHLQPFKGSALRGAFGHTFKRLVCFQPQQCQQRCESGNSCPYGYIFETTPSTGIDLPATLGDVLHPMIIEPPSDKREVIPPGQSLSFGLTLIGHGLNYLPYFIAVFRELGQVGLGRSRGRYHLGPYPVGQPHRHRRGSFEPLAPLTVRLSLLAQRTVRQTKIVICQPHLSSLALSASFEPKISFVLTDTNRLATRRLMTWAYSRPGSGIPRCCVIKPVEASPQTPLRTCCVVNWLCKPICSWVACLSSRKASNTPRASIVSEVRYLLSDGLGSVRQVANEAGEVDAYYEFDPYGSPITEGGEPYSYTGEWWEGEVGLLHLRARWYAPGVGRFVNRDGLGRETHSQFQTHPQKLTTLAKLCYSPNTFGGYTNFAETFMCWITGLK
jgi:RHS repeat-associated protein